MQIHQVTQLGLSSNTNPHSLEWAMRYSLGGTIRYGRSSERHGLGVANVLGLAGAKVLWPVSGQCVITREEPMCCGLSNLLQPVRGQ